jgi:hypothetical protein
LRELRGTSAVMRGRQRPRREGWVARREPNAGLRPVSHNRAVAGGEWLAGQGGNAAVDHLQGEHGLACGHGGPVDADLPAVPQARAAPPDGWRRALMAPGCQGCVRRAVASVTGARRGQGERQSELSHPLLQLGGSGQAGGGG